MFSDQLRMLCSALVALSALAAEQIAQDDPCHEDDRETRKAEQTDEEEFESDEVHGSHSTPAPRLTA